MRDGSLQAIESGGGQSMRLWRRRRRRTVRGRRSRKHNARRTGGRLGDQVRNCVSPSDSILTVSSGKDPMSHDSLPLHERPGELLWGLFPGTATMASSFATVDVTNCLCSGTRSLFGGCSGPEAPEPSPPIALDIGNGTLECYLSTFNYQKSRTTMMKRAPCSPWYKVGSRRWAIDLFPSLGIVHLLPVA